MLETLTVLTTSQMMDMPPASPTGGRRRHKISFGKMTVIRAEVIHNSSAISTQQWRNDNACLIVVCINFSVYYLIINKFMIQYQLMTDYACGRICGLAFSGGGSRSLFQLEEYGPHASDILSIAWTLRVEVAQTTDAFPLTARLTLVPLHYERFFVLPAATPAPHTANTVGTFTYCDLA